MSLTYDQLNTACLTSLQLPSGYNIETLIGLQVLYGCGCRPEELMRQDLWSDYDGSQLQLITVKRSGVRLINKLLLPSNFVDAIENGRWYFQSARISSIYGVFSKFWPYPNATVKNKKVKLYSYRYRYIKYLNEEGYTSSEIAEFMGWTTNSLVSTYVEADIDV